MENERIAILKMLENGKITAGEAAKLLESVSSTGARPTVHQTAAAPKSISTMPNTQNQNQNAYSGGTVSSTRFEEFAGEMSRKFETFAKDMEPKLQKFTETVVENTASMADKISKGLSAPPRPAAPYSPPRPAAGGAMMIERNIEIKVTGRDNELNLSGLNAEVMLKGYNGDKITAKLTAKLNRPGASIELMQLGNKFFLQYDEEEFKSVAIDAYVPEYLFRTITVQTINAPIQLSMLQAEMLSVKNMNGNSELQNLHCGNLSYEASNGKLKIINVEATNAKIENFNGDIYVSGFDAANLHAEAFNGAVNMSIPQFEKFDDYTWIVDVSNAGLTMNIPGGMGIGYYVKAHSALNDIKFALTGMNYLSNSRNHIEACSYDFDSARTKVKLSLETSNGPLVVN